MTESTPPSEPSTPASSPIVDWFSRHGIKAIAVLAVLELLFHAWAVWSTRRH